MDDLGAWIRDHEVCFEIGPLFELDQHPGRSPAKVQVGLEVCLLARLVPRSAAGTAAAPSAGAVHARLSEIAGAVAEDVGDARCDVSPFDGAVRARPEAAWAPEVQLSLRIVHRHDYLRPLDDGERRTADGVQRRLQALGVRAKAWRRAA
jgi:hypothetical protein